VNSILIVDDEAGIRQMLGLTLAGDGYNFREAANAEEATNEVKIEMPQLILLDWMLPGISGVDFARKLKQDPKTQDIPIIMLTAKGEESDKIRGLDVGADDYITKPFSTRELLARVRAVIRRASSAGDDAVDIVRLDGISIDSHTHRVLINDKALDLSPTEFKLLQFFISHPERVYSRTQLLDNVWGDQTYIEERTVDVHIRRLRKLLDPHGYSKHIQTVRSVGYRYSTQAE
jgi:two-component system, OmpR family, phosphate regulon response regulator PhoB